MKTQDLGVAVIDCRSPLDEGKENWPNTLKIIHASITINTLRAGKNSLCAQSATSTHWALWKCEKHSMKKANLLKIRYVSTTSTPGQKVTPSTLAQAT